MNGLVFLIPVALLMGFTGLVAFVWSVSHGQFEDCEGASMRILIDEDPIDD